MVSPLVVIVIPVPATKVNVSSSLSAVTVVCPETSINLKESSLFCPPPVDANVMVSALVVIVILLPATRVNVSASLSATTLDCPETVMVLNEYSLASPALPLPDN